MYYPKYSMFFDMHTMQACPDVGHAFDAEIFAEQLKNTGVDLVGFHAKCNQGFCYFDTKTGIRHPSLPEGRDLFGKAAPLFRKYLYEVEQGCQAMAGTPIRSVYNSFAFPYLNPENLRRWSRYFDEMETLAADNPDALYHVKLARLSVDAAYITVTADSDSWPQTEHRIGLLEKRIQQLHEKYHYSFDMSRLAKWYHALKQKLAGK